MSKNTRNRILLTALAALLLVVVAVGGTVAYLKAQTSTVTNTFTTSSINVELAETTTSYQMIPGGNISKDPKVTVTNPDTDAYVFVKIEKSNNFDNFMTYEIADGWTAVSVENETVYYREVSKTATTKTFSVLKGDKVSVKSDVTTAQMSALNESTKPTLSFTAYVIQKDNITEVNVATIYGMAKAN